MCVVLNNNYYYLRQQSLKRRIKADNISIFLPLIRMISSNPTLDVVWSMPPSPLHSFIQNMSYKEQKQLSLNFRKTMEMENEVDLIGEVEDELKGIRTPTKNQQERTYNSGSLSTPDDLSKKEIDFKINISCIDNGVKNSPSASINMMLDKTSHDLYGFLKSSLSSNEFLPIESSMQELCGYHQKPLDVVCIRDLTLICSNCALFGVHKGHEFKSLCQVNKDKVKMQNSIERVIGEKHEIEDIIRNSDDEVVDVGRVQERKKGLLEAARREYSKLRDILDESEKELTELIEREAVITEERIQNENKLLLRPFTSYHTWEHKAIRYLECLQSPDRFQQQIVMLNYDKSSKIDIIHEGEQVIAQIKKNLTKIKENKAIAIQQFEIVVDNTVPAKLKTFITLPSFKSISNKLIRSSSNGNILTQSRRYTVNTATRKSVILEQDTSNQIKRACNTSSTGMGSRKASRSRLDQSFEKRVSMRSPEYSPNSSKRLEVSKEKRFKHTDLKMNQKYTKVYESVLNDNTEIVQLMHADLPNKAITQILKLLPQRPKIKILKLNGNKLTDQISQDLFTNLKHISNLNLSGNLLTDDFVISMSNNISSLRSLKTIVLSQNKISSRNVKPLIDQIRRLGITVSI